MKLIDLLVQELPKRGGWPEGADCCCLSGVDSDGVTIQFRFIPRRNEFLFIPDYDHIDILYKGDATEFITCGVITKEVYQSALAASQKPAWNGEGLPPVGCECEVKRAFDWVKCKILFISDTHVVLMADEECCWNTCACQFRPLRTEAERKRDAAIEAMQREADEGDNWVYNEYEIIYDAIAAGKIPGVKLDD